MRILYAINSGVIGGAEKHIIDLAQGLSSEDNSIHIWCKKGPNNDLFAKAGAKVVIRDIHFDICLSYIFNLYKYLKKEKIDVVHTHDLKAGVNALIAARLAGIKVRIGHIHTPLSTWEVTKLKKTVNLVVYYFINRFISTHEIAITEVVKEIKIKERLDPNKIVVIPNAIKLETKIDKDESIKFITDWGFQDKYIIGYVGRLSREKNLTLLIKAFSKIYKENDNLRLALIGGGEEEVKLKKLIEELGIVDSVRITGVFAEEDKKSLFKTINLFVFPSITEGFGYVPLEALMLGIPVISSDIPVLQEVLGESVLYFRSHDIDDLYEKIKKAVITRYMPDTILVNDIIQKYSMSNFIKSYSNLYRESL